MSKAENPSEYPKVVQGRGGWFAVWREGDLGSGPWDTEEAATLALQHKYDEARIAEGRQS